MSTNGLNDAACGPGVYLTSMPPNGSFSKLQIAQNNYGEIYEQKMEKVLISSLLSSAYDYCKMYALGDVTITRGILMNT